MARSGATGFQIGCLRNDVPAHLAGWYAHAQYRGARIIAENHPGPVEAAEALARKLLTGAKCKCGKLVALSDHGAFAYDEAGMADGSVWTAQAAAAAGQCRWRRNGPRWEGGCQSSDRAP